MKAENKALNQKIKQQGYRMTRQREVVLEELTKIRSHPKADEIYQLVRKKLPNISFGTVYRNLKLLKELGLVRELSFGKSFSRFEAFSTAVATASTKATNTMASEEKRKTSIRVR